MPTQNHDGLIREAKAHLLGLTVTEITHLMFDVFQAKGENITGITIRGMSNGCSRNTGSNCRTTYSRTR
jgi:hypothetical protein